MRVAMPAERGSTSIGVWRIALLALASIGWVGCLNYPDASERVEEQIVYTFYDPAANFPSYRTYSLSDEVVVFKEGDAGPVRETLDPVPAAMLVARVVQEMTSRGFVRVGSADSPQLGLSLSVISGTVTATYYSYWSSYWGYYGWYYYYPYVYSYEYDVGTLALEATDLARAGAPRPIGPLLDGGPIGDNRLNVVWGSLTYGVLSEAKTENVENALNGITQAFKQSPYFVSAGGGT